MKNIKWFESSCGSSWSARAGKAHLEVHIPTGPTIFMWRVIVVLKNSGALSHGSAKTELSAKRAAEKAVQRVIEAARIANSRR